MRKLLLVLLFCLACLAIVGCESPKVSGVLTIHVANFSPQIPDNVFAAGLAFIQQQLTGNTGELNVVLVPDVSGNRLSRNDDAVNVLLTPGPSLSAAYSDHTLRLTIPPDYRAEDPAWRDLLKQQIAEAVR